MATNGLIDAQFDRAVEIVQGLPKTGPIQTDYEEKLTMYRYDFVQSFEFGSSNLYLWSLFKQGAHPADAQFFQHLINA